MKQSTSRARLRRTIVVLGIVFLATTVWPKASFGYDVHQDRLDCPKGTTLARIEINPRQCRAQPKRGIPATRGRRACCTFDRDPSKERCLPFPGCPGASVE